MIIPGLSNIISVAASDQHDELASFSNYGTGTVDIAAPGVNIYSSVMTAGSGITDIVSGENGWTKQAEVSVVNSGVLEQSLRSVVNTSISLELSGQIISLHMRQIRVPISKRIFRISLLEYMIYACKHGVIVQNLLMKKVISILWSVVLVEYLKLHK